MTGKIARYHVCGMLLCVCDPPTHPSFHRTPFWKDSYETGSSAYLEGRELGIIITLSVLLCIFIAFFKKQKLLENSLWWCQQGSHSCGLKAD